MSASFKSGTREPFNAFVCDDDTLELVRQVAGDLGWPTEKCNKGGLRNAVQTLSVSASPNILFVDMSESGDPINDINALAEVCEPGTVVIAAGQVNDVRLYRDLLSSGIQDYLLKPLSVDQLRDSFAQAQAMLSAPKHADGAADRPHHLMAVVGVRGGVGASLVSTSLAWAFSEQAERHTALLDLDVHFGTGALTLDLEPGRGLIDAIDNPSRIDGLFIERAMVRASDKLSLLSAEAPIHQPVLTDGSAFFQLEEELRNAFEMTVVDIPRQVLIPFPTSCRKPERLRSSPMSRWPQHAIPFACSPGSNRMCPAHASCWLPTSSRARSANCRARNLNPRSNGRSMWSSRSIPNWSARPPNWASPMPNCARAPKRVRSGTS